MLLVYQYTWTEPFFELNHLHLCVALMDDGMESDEDLLLTKSSFSQESLLPNFCIGSIVDGIFNNDNFGQQNSERNLVNQSRGTGEMTLEFKFYPRR